MSNTSPSRFRVSDLPQNRATRFCLTPDSDQMSAIADEMNLTGLRKMRFEGQITSEGKTDWRLEARLGATVVQPCVVTLDPVTTRIEDQVIRRFLANLPDETSSDDDIDGEIEMPEDETIDKLGSHIDLEAVMIEALALGLPQYPRLGGAHLEAAQFTEPGKAPMQDEDARPFAGLKALRDSLDGEG
ncbi:DUF177 domain-containing protein [Alisedimentitalea sp. MJ-SS2]|uniref:YceD family protein n=1 Tax=Aliisedimentitalea sp. MJ-SS2 TaxID=3049795 RepID=UPI0029157BD7|nr:DUF177 domain-containing protein [Alisedimentitalea sp. MJ-SS2]MDU8926805.1 DUF177 domain-containing protein [Alisedimentitalea sp. MJ-SS2]